MPIKGDEAKKQLKQAIADEQKVVQEEIEAQNNKKNIPQVETIRRHGVRQVPGPNPTRTPMGEKNYGKIIENKGPKQNERGMESKRRRLTKLQNELGKIADLLEDPLVADIWRNNNGTVWVNKIGIGTKQLDQVLSDDTTEALIGTVAESMNATVNAAKPIFEGILPTHDKSRFSASIPPVCNGGFMFCIRKRAVMSRSLDDYVEAGSATPDQVAYIRKRIYARDNFLIVGATGSGKALPLTTQILTPNGYLPMKDIQIGSFVIGKNGKPTRVNNIFPQGKRQSWKLHFSDGTTAIADDEHLWSVQTKVSRSRELGWTVRTTNELRNNLIYADGKPKWFIPVVDSLQLNKQSIETNPYLLGLLITKKTFDGSNQGLDAYLNKKGVKKNSPLPFSDLLQKVGMLGQQKNKIVVPKNYLFNTHQVRLRLFQGLMDGGAWFQADTNHIVYTTRSKKLAENVVWLVQSFGGIARIGERKDTSLRIYIRLPKKIAPSANKETLTKYKACTYRQPSRSIIKIERHNKLEMQCIAVAAKDELYVIEHAVVTHNTTLGNAILREMSEGAPPDDRFIIIEDTAELQCEAQNRVEVLTAPGVTINDLLRASMRWSPKRICIGELRGSEAADLIKAWNTGHKGGITTIHSETGPRGLDRLEDLIAESGQIPNKRRIADAVQCIIVIADIGKGVRKITQICRITGAVEGDYDIEYFE